MRDDSENYHQLITSGVPLLDVRAPVEFAKGAIADSVLLPLLDDEQRHLVGTEYASAGKQAALALGEHIATDELREVRVAAWSEHVRTHPEGYLFCFRGGLRSRISQQWLADRGIHYPRVVGGYKAMRNYLLAELERLGSAANIVVVAGATGSGKTALLNRWPQSLDLEGMARHRGSAFGGTFRPQPAQASWENDLAAQWLQREAQSKSPVLIEAESHLIGRISLPNSLQQALASADMLVLQCSLQRRVERIRKDYIEFAYHHFCSTEPESALELLHDFMFDRLTRIKNRLGGERYKRLTNWLPAAIDEVRREQAWRHFERIIESLLVDYYDPLYQHKFDSRSNKVLATGFEAELYAWLQREHGDATSLQSTEPRELRV